MAGFRKLLRFEDLLAHGAVLALAHSGQVHGTVAPWLLRTPRLKAFLLHPGSPLPTWELAGVASPCVLVGFDDGHMDGAAMAADVRAAFGEGPPRELVIGPVPGWFTPCLPFLASEVERLHLCDNLKAGQVVAGIELKSTASFLASDRSASPLFIPTRDGSIADLYRKAFSGRVVRTFEDVLRPRLEAIRGEFGELPVYDASLLEGSLQPVLGDNDLARLVQFAYRHLTPEAITYDVGAHAGNTALLFLQRCRRVVAFEPDPEPFAVLASRFGEGQAILPLRTAVGRLPGTAFLQLDDRGASGGSSSLLGHLCSERRPSPRIEVPLTSLDAFHADTGLRPGFIKVDVEGSEPDVIEGAWNLLVDVRPPLVFELNPRFALLRPDDYMGMMDRLDVLYRLECLETGEDPRRRFLKPEMPPLTNVACHPR